MQEKYICCCPKKQYKYNCIQCYGCIHGKRKNQCIECNGSSICPCGKRNDVCKIHCKNPLNLRIRQIICSSRQNDKKKNRYNEKEHIDKLYLEYLFNTIKNCPYCDVELNHFIYRSDLTTIERINNNIGHIKNNCILSCHSCNVKRVGQRNGDIDRLIYDI